MSQKTDKPKLKVRLLVLPVTFLIGIFIILPKLPNLSESISLVKNADYRFVALALLIQTLSYFAAGGVYLILSSKKLLIGRTTLISLASAFTNKLLPANSGTLALNIQYLGKQGNNLPTSSAIVATVNLVGIIGHSALFAIISALSHDSILTIDVPIKKVSLVILTIGLILGIGLLSPSFRDKIRRVLRDILKYEFKLAKNPIKLLWAIACSLLITLCYVFILYLSAQAVGHSISLFEALFALTIGVAAGTLTPTPGGLGGTEAGMAAALVATGMFGSWAIGIVLIYRFITYWLPIFPGFLAFNLAARRKYI